MSEQEQAAGRRGTFPEAWGTPEGSPFSEELVAWVREQIRRHAPAAEMRKRDAACRAATTRLAVLLTKRECP